MSTRLGPSRLVSRLARAGLANGGAVSHGLVGFLVEPRCWLPAVKLGCGETIAVGVGGAAEWALWKRAGRGRCRGRSRTRSR